MKKIVIHSITLVNWRGEKKRTTLFHEDAPTYVMGGNGLGKTRHFDAFCWLLFGKDSHERKDYELRTYDANHQPLHHCECSVEAVISVDGDKHTIKREYKEQWIKPRGQVEEVFKGNITECTWDGVPVKVSDFQKRISANIIDETVFKMITNPLYFTEKMKWQLQRETLLQMAGAKTDEEIAADNADFHALLDHLNGKSLSDFRKELAAEKKRLKAEKDDIEPRIDQTQKMMPEAEDFDALKIEQDELQQELSNVQKQLDNSTNRDKAQADKAREIVAQIAAIKAKRADMYYQYKQQLEDDAEKKNEQRKNIEKQCRNTASESSNASIDIRHAEEREAYLTEAISQLSLQLDDLRKEWYEINQQEYDGSDICPHCGQRMPQDKIASALEHFYEQKAKLIGMNNDRGRALAQQRKAYEEELAEKKEELVTLKKKKKSCEERMQSLYAELEKHPSVKVGQVNEDDIPGYAELTNKVDELEAEAEKAVVQDDNQAKEALARQRENIQRHIYDIQARLAKKAQIDKGYEEIASLQERGKVLAQLIADIEKREYTAAQFSKKRIEDCETRINAMFHLVRFQLFDYTQDGNEYETCLPLVGGVTYAVANTAAQINAGLDIINTLCKFNNVSAPIFCDGAESVNEYIPTNSQMIFLQVTNDKQLVIK